ncbi:MAG: FKBP-type peptidyl-prolyl cis-trans isomerase [Novosphingobium sp.]
MTEITRVPLQPVAKGVLTKLWLGVLGVALAAAALVWFSLPPSVDVTVLRAGTGRTPTKEDLVFVKYIGKLDSGKEFQRSPEGSAFPVPGVFPDGVPFQLEGSIPGFAEGLAKVQQGGKYKLHIPAAKAYGAEEKRDPQTGELSIPANSNLNFEIEVTGIIPRAEAEARAQQAQAMMQQMQAGQEKGGKAPTEEAPTMPEPKTK